MTFKDYPYNRPELEDFKKDAQEIFNQMDDAQTKEALLSAIKTYIEEIKQLLTMQTLAQIRNSIDTRDEFYDAEIAYWDENGPFVEEVNNVYYQKLMAHPLLDSIKDEFPTTYFQLIENTLRVFDPKIIKDLQAENKLTTEYTKLIASAQIEFDDKTLTLAQMRPYNEHKDRNIRQSASNKVWAWFEEHENEFDEIFDSLVKVRTQMAHKLGFESFTEMGYARMQRLDYNQEMVANYRKQVLEDVVPIANKLYQRQAERLQVDKLAYYDVPLQFVDGNATPIGSFEDTIQTGKEMYHDLSAETSEFIDHMIDNELLDLIAKPGKQSGGYMTYLYDFESPFIFSNFNGTSGDVDVLTHEAGHAFQGYQSHHIQIPEVHMPTYEACEIHSMSMEFITWRYMDKFFGDQADKYRFAHLSDALEFLPYGVLVDHFQHEVYNNPDMTPDERKATWKKLDAQYRPHYDFSDNEFADKGTWWYRQGHIFQSPFYYIDYTLAQVCAFQFWKRFNIDKDPEAWNDYLAICKVGGTQSFLEIVKTANLLSPFEDGTLKAIIGDIDTWLEQH